ncbi:MAG TPA: class I SAM-dependent methyltransferase [Acidimicrobiales bacterium]|jgi:ubiquinone/menaquinone biosynthesis C-methylase UbiE|nr:class I SAM-dependent methyltransferase [Acidimicrobiales bacterium]
MSGVFAATSAGWWPAELAFAGRENLDAHHVARYDGKEDADAADEVALLQELGLPADATVLDMGAGTGQLTLAVASACRRVVAVDVSPVMLARLATKVGDAGISNVEIVRAGFLSYEHSGSAVDVAYSRYALHHLPDFWKAVALDRLHQWMKPGGLMRLWDVVYSFDPRDARDAIEAWCTTGGANPEADWSRAELEEHVRDEHSTFSWLLEPMFDRAGFSIERAEYSTDRIFAKYVLRA